MSGAHPPCVVLYGDSNTHGTPPMADIFDMERFPPGVRWTSLLADALPAGTQIVEAGLPGRTTVFDDPIGGPHLNGLNGLPLVLHTHRPVTLLVIMLGTNDMRAMQSVTPDDVAFAHARLMEAAMRSMAGPGGGAPDLFIVAPPPIDEAGALGGVFVGGAEKSRQLAPRLKAMAARFGAGFLDAAEHVAVDPLDGVHWPAEGHAAFAAALGPALAARLAG
jgi:lysophospholipase L1-like esterase